MAVSTLRQVLNYFEDAERPLSLSLIARELQVPKAQVESMVQYWVRKGRIREVVDGGGCTDCASCGVTGTCPFVMEMPRSFEVIKH